MSRKEKRYNMGWFLYCWPLPAKSAEPLASICLVRKSKSRQAFYLSAGLPYPLFLYASFSSVQVSVAYTVWIGLGTAGSVLFNMILFKEPKNMIRILSLLLIVIGVVGLKLFA